MIIAKTLAFSSLSNKLISRPLLTSLSNKLLSRPLVTSTSLNMFQSKQDEKKQVGDVLVDVNLLKSLELNDVNGNRKKLGTVMGNGKSVVVFLRHLG